MIYSKKNLFLLILSSCLSGSVLAEDAACEKVAPAQLNLAQAMERALQCGPEFQTFRWQYEGQLADAKILKQRPNPNFSYGVSMLNLHPSQYPENRSRMETGTRIDQLFELGGKGKYKIRAADALEVAAQYDLKFNEKLALVKVQHAYFDLLAATQRNQDLRDLSQLNIRAKEVAEIRHRAGDISQFEYQRLLIDIQRTQNDLELAQIELVKNQTQFAQLLAYQKGLESLQLAKNWPTPMQSWPALDYEKLLQRSDLQALRQKTISAENQRLVGRALKIPDPTIGLQYNHQPVTGLANNGTINTYSIGVSIPLFVRHAYQGEARKAEVEYYQARDQQLRAERDALQVVLEQEKILKANQARHIRLQEDILPAAEHAAKSAEYAYQKGAIQLLDLLDTRRTLRIVRSEAAQIQAEYAKSQVLYRLLIEVEDLRP